VLNDFDELIINGLYSANLLNSAEISSTLSVSISLFDVYEGKQVGSTLTMTDTQPAGEVLHVESPLWCIPPVTNNVYWIHIEASAQKINGGLWFIKEGWARIDLSKGELVGP
jgi:hypothetical protein